VVDDASFKDVEASGGVAFRRTMVKTIKGASVVWRFADATSTTSLGSILSKTISGFTRSLPKANPGWRQGGFEAPSGEWRTLTISCLATKSVQFEREETLEAKDDAFSKAGKVGLWSKAERQTSFDDFTATEVTVDAFPTRKTR